MQDILKNKVKYQKKNVVKTNTGETGIRYPAGTRRCFNVVSTLIFGGDVEQPFFNVNTTLIFRRRIINVVLTLNQRFESSVGKVPNNYAFLNSC